MESTEHVDDEMFVTKRNGVKEKVSFDKILNRIKKIGQPKELNVNYTALVMKIIDQIFDGIQTEQIDEVLAQQCASMCSIHYDYYVLASRLLISNHQKQTRNYNMYDYVQLLTDKFGDKYISNEFREIVKSNTEKIEEMIITDRDYEIDYFGFKTLERAYLMRKDDVVIENIQYMWMRVAIQIHGNNMKKVKETYDCLSQKMFIHATPTLFNSGTKRPQLSSCFLLGMEEDSINGIFNTLKDCALISKWAGGIGLHIHNIRSSGSHIEGTNGKSHGIVPMLRVYNNTARYCDQGGKRHGSFAMYIEPWHADIENYLDLRKNHGDEEARARDLFYALWIPDYFMECVHKNDYWYLMCPNKSPNLYNVYGSEFTELYKSYVENGQYVKKVKAREIWFKILDSQMETGTPYMLYKDSANKKSNQKNLGVIKSSNLCTEIIEFSNEEESAVCNLASISLPAFVNKTENKYDLERLSQISEIVTENLNNIIDSNFYPTEKTKRSNFRHRPIGIGVQGLADVFAQLKIPFESDKAKELNSKIFEAIYYGSMKRSNDISIQRQKDISDIQNYLIEQTKKSNYEFWIWFIQAMKNDIYDISLMNFFNDFTESMLTDSSIFHDVSSDMVAEKYFNTKPTMREIFGTEFCKALLIVIEEVEKECIYKEINIPKLITACDTNTVLIRKPLHCGAYSSFEGSPLSKGELQFDLWGEPKEDDKWIKLKYNIKQYGTRNSLCIAPMPTASTSQILGNNECFEPFTSNIYMRRTIAGEFTLVNKYLFRELYDLKLWNNAMKNEIIRNKGSVQSIETIPEDIRQRFKVSWEIKPETIMDMARDRSIYICQSQSMNLWVEDPNYKNLTKIHFYGWKKGLKTGMYYLRRKAKHQAQQFTVEPVNTPSSPTSTHTTQQLDNKVNPITQQTEDDVCELCSA